MSGWLARIAAVSIATATTAGGATAQIPPNIAAQLKPLGNIVDPVTSAEIYRPLQPNPPYKGVKVTRDQSYGPDKRNILDVFQPENGKGLRPVLLFVSGGLGDKIEQMPNGDAFYDNVMLWAVANRMTGVSIERRGAFTGDINPEDVALAIQWVRKNIARYGGDPKHIIIWGHSAGALSIADYLSQPRFYGPDGVGINGAILMAGPYNIAPVEVKDGGFRLRMGRTAEVTGLPPLPTDPEVLRRTSVVPGLKALKIPVLLAAGEFDAPLLRNTAKALNDELRMAGNPPTFVVYKGHGHLSEIFSVNTSDRSVTGPILAWMRGVK
ncbi:MAG: alpha/beta hydrolase [Caulobacteraceae bacterium]